MASLDDIRSFRVAKQEALRRHGMNPYPLHSGHVLDIATLLSSWKSASKKKSVTLHGRVMSIRGQGAVLFFDIFDGAGKFQGLLKKGEIEDAPFMLFRETVDVGDFVEIEGSLFVTKRKEKTLEVHSWRMLSKSLRPLPEKWHGLQDTEERYRRRYLDILMNEASRKTFLTRTALIREIRSVLDKKGYMEVETPLLQPLAGGAAARPFKTHHEALNLDLSLRIAPELYLKELLIGGFSKVYELGRSFRNEGIDAVHNPEFTSLEVYTAYSMPATERAFTETLLRTVVKKVLGTLTLSYNEKEISFKKPFAVISFADVLQRYALLTEEQYRNGEEIALKAKQLGIETRSGEGEEKTLDAIYKKVCRPKLIGPIFIVDYPTAFSPLAKENPEKPGCIDRFQLVVGGLEILNGFAELNDPIEQEKRFIEQEKKRQGGDSEAHMKDEAYVEAMEYGMPPGTGWGLGVDRLAMLLTDSYNIRDVILFPTLRPKN